MNGSSAPSRVAWLYLEVWLLYLRNCLFITFAGIFFDFSVYCILHVFINIFCTMAKMTKSQLLDSLATRTNMSKKDVGMFLDVLTELAYAEVKNNGEFTLPGVGKLIKQNRAARMGRNPATGESIQIPAKTVVKFRVAKAAKDAVL